MKSRSYVGMALFATYCLVVSACGGGGGGGGGTPSKAVAVTATTPILMNYSTTVFANFSGIPVGNGSAVTFSANNGGVLTATTLVGAVGNPIRTATTRVKIPAASQPPSPQTRNVTVTASANGYSGNTVVNFIPQPTKAVVHVALNRSVKDLAALYTLVRSNIGPFNSWSSATMTQAPAYTGEGSPVDTNQPIYSWFLLTLGIDVLPSDTLLDITYRIPGTVGIPFFSVVPDGMPISLSFNRYSSTSNLPPNAVPAVYLSPSDYVLKTDYYLGNTLLATH